MNGIEKITGRIESDARKKAQEILEEARVQARSVTDNYARHAQTLRRELLDKAEDQVLLQVQRMTGAGELEGRKELLRTKQALLDETFALALDKLRQLPQEEYVALLTGWLVKAAPEGRGEVIMNPSDRARVGKDVVTGANEALAKTGSMLTLSQETRELQGGFVLRDGLVEVNCALETLVDQEKETLYGQVAGLLFPEG